MQTQWDTIIVGAGPAGMSAAIQCAKAGLDVLVLDRQDTPGGQIWKGAARAGADKVRFFGKEYAHGTKLVQQFLQSKITYMANALVWFVEGTSICVSIEGQSHQLKAKSLVLATGGMERPVPVEGWDLPCVMGVGACDLLLKSAGLTPAAPVVVCGNGPLILQTLAHLCHLKVPVAGLVLTGNMTKNSWKAFLQSYKILGRPLYFMNGLSYSLQVLLKKIPTFYNSKDVVITEENGAKVTFTSGRKSHSLEAKTVLLHEGIVSASRITHLLGCRHQWSSRHRYWYAEANEWGETSVSDVYVAGDMAGVCGAEAAQAKGNIVGIGLGAKLGKYTQDERDALAQKYQRTLTRCRWMQDFTDAFFEPKPEALLPADNAIVCRCEEKTAKEIREAVLDGCYTTDAAKIACRCGMGLCQGRMCSGMVAAIISEVHGIPLERLKPYKARAPLFPIEMGELANSSICLD